MLTKRIIPCLDVKNGKVVKGVQFKNHRIIGDPIKLAAKYSEENADELLKTIYKLKPTTIKGTYIKSISMSSTMSPGIGIETKLA